MSMLFMESFGVASLTDLDTYGKYWERAVAAGSMSLGAGRVPGSQCLLLTSSAGMYGSMGTHLSFNFGRDPTTFFIGMAFMERGSTLPSQGFFQLLDSTISIQIDVTMNTLHQLVVHRGQNGTVLCTSSVATLINRWYFLELGVKIDPTAGWAELRQDGVLVASYYGTGTGRANANGNTRASTTNGARFFYIGNYVQPNQTGSTSASYQDVVVMDDQGTVNNTFLGDRRVLWLQPNGPGAHTDFAPGGTSPGGGFANPSVALSPTFATTGGTVQAGTYTVGYTYSNAVGETQLSPTATISPTGTTATITVPQPALPAGASWNLYMSQAGGGAGALTKQNVAPLSGSSVLSAPPTTTGAPPPTANTTGTNWQSTNKNPVPGDATYVQSTVVGATDTYALADLPAGTISVDAVLPHAIMRKTDAGFRFGAPVVRVAGVDVALGSTPLQQTYARIAQLLETRPDNNPWTVADVNALEVGARIVS